jgi:hypothetical protein
MRKSISIHNLRMVYCPVLQESVGFMYQGQGQNRATLKIGHVLMKIISL